MTAPHAPCSVFLIKKFIVGGVKVDNIVTATCTKAMLQKAFTETTNAVKSSAFSFRNLRTAPFGRLKKVINATKIFLPHKKPK